MNINDPNTQILLKSFNKNIAGHVISNQEISEEQTKELLKGNEKLFNSLEKQIEIQSGHLKQAKENYEKLDKLYSLKVKESEKFEQSAIESKKYNIKMLVITLISGGIALASLIATILISIFK